MNTRCSGTSHLHRSGPSSFLLPGQSRGPRVLALCAAMTASSSSFVITSSTRAAARQKARSTHRMAASVSDTHATRSRKNEVSVQLPWPGQ